MPYDPTLPADNTKAVAAQMRAQFNALNDLIQSIPVGPPGPQGDPGPQGPPFANAIVDGVTTFSPGEPATVDVSFDGANVHFAFGIPAGEPGSAGADGEVTNAVMTAAIDAAIAGTASNTNAVATLDTPFANDPPTLADMEALREKLNELILAMRR